jgi:hypothetical protein
MNVYVHDWAAHLWFYIDYRYESHAWQTVTMAARRDSRIPVVLNPCSKSIYVNWKHDTLRPHAAETADEFYGKVN